MPRGVNLQSGTFEMKEGFDKEIDSLLQRRARGTAELRSWGDGADDGAHLDADELGAFAEGALPAAARLTAASHLADCERCRGVAVGLARVAGFEVKPQPLAAVASAESARPSAWRAFVASLFAPRMLRYATPVLALSLVAAVSYVALRSDKGAVQMAREGRQTGTLQEPPAAPATSTTDAMNANVAGIIGQNTNVAPKEAAPAAGTQSSAPKGHGNADAQPTDAETAREDAPSAAAPPPPPPAAAEESPVMSKAAPRPVTTDEGEAAKDDKKEKSENRDKSVRGAEPADEVSSADLATQQRNRAASRANEVQMPDGGARNQQKRAGTDNNASTGFGNVGGAGAAPKESERAAPRAETVGRTRATRPARKADEDDRDGQTRTAAGHRFRREGSAWIDVNYRPNMPSTGVRRGTETFRALVADVPEVGRVAAALDGDVTIVVSGRAYRIH
jgi:hypothetical protein